MISMPTSDCTGAKVSKFQSFFIDNNHITWHKSNIYTNNSILEINMSYNYNDRDYILNKHTYIHVFIIMKLEFLAVTRVYYKN